MENAGNQRLQIVWGYWLKQQSMHAGTDMQCSEHAHQERQKGEYSALCVAEGGKAGARQWGTANGHSGFHWMAMC